MDGVIQNHPLDAARSTLRKPLGAVFRHSEFPCEFRLCEYDESETSVTLRVGAPVGLKTADVAVVTADFSASSQFNFVGIMCSVPDATNKYFWAMTKGTLADLSKILGTTVTITTNGSTAAGHGITWSGDDATTGASPAFDDIGLATAADASTSLSAATIGCFRGFAG